MSFVKKIWKDRLSAFPKRWKIKFDGSAEAQSAELELDDGTVITQGDRFNAATMNDLENRIEAAFNSSVAGVTSFNDRSGAVQSQSGDYTSAQITHIYSNEETTDVQTAINNLTTGSLETYEGNPSQWDTAPTAASTKPVTSDGIKTSFNNVDKRLRTGGTTGTDFYFDYQDGKYGWNSSSARGASTFHPFKQPVTDTKTITSKTTTDLGEDHTYRYIDTTGVVNTNSGTYAASSRGTALDMGASNSYRYVNTNSVPNSNSGTYTFPADNGGTKDLGATNSYRYVNATQVYNYAKYQLIASTGVWVTCKKTSSINFSWYYTTQEKFKYVDIGCSNDQGIPLNSGDTITLWISSSSEEYWGSVYFMGPITSGQYLGGMYRFAVPDGITILEIYNNNDVPRDYVIRMTN